MLNKLTFISILFGLSLFTSCKSGFSPEVQKLYDEVMVIHDEVMPEMGTIHKLTKELKSIQKDPKAKINEEELTNNLRALDYADESMMDWMHQFKVPKDGTDEIQLEYLTDQKKKMTKVSNDMKTIIKNAKNAVKRYQ